jgi:DNA-binding NarL/FixJ family response regulator
VPLVLADQWMPGMTGTQFLARVKQVIPTARRGLLHRHDDPILRPATGKGKGPAAGKIMEAVKTTARDATPACHGISQQDQDTAQIARQLVISPKTADSHLQHIYAKIGCSTRGAAVLFALRHNLVS